LNYAFHLPASLIVAAVALDLALGDPVWFPHPVRMIGWAIAASEIHIHTGNRRADLINGGLLSIALIAAAGLTAWATIAIGRTFNPYAGAVAATLIAWTTLAIRGLDDAAREVESCLNRGDEGAARYAIRALVGRDPETLDRQGLVRATIELIAEHLSDGFIAPLLFLAVAGPVAALAYKAINTLDSMIGYRDARYLYFGRIAARLDDVANLVPSRLTALTICLAAAIATGRAGGSLRACVADGSKHDSPNAGYPEAAMAGALGVQLGGDAFYSGVLERRPCFGHAELPLDLGALRSARNIVWVASAFSLALVLASKEILGA
jgi:adenosylcobinamide-phosphate synthase